MQMDQTESEGTVEQMPMQAMSNPTAATEEVLLTLEEDNDHNDDDNHDDNDDDDDDDDNGGDDPTSAAPQLPDRWSVFLSKCFYFWVSSAYSCVSPFLPVFYVSLGFSKTQVGLLSSLQPFLGFFGGSFGAALADKTRRHKLVFCVSLVMSAAFRLSLLAATSFVATIFLVLTTELFNSPVYPLLDNSVLEILRSQTHDYGKIRLWGAVGWGIFAAVVGWIITMTDLRASFVAYASLMVIVLLLLIKYPMGQQRLDVSHPAEEAKHQQRLRERMEDPIWLRLGRLFRSFSVCAFFFTAFTLGYSMGSITTILFIYLKTLGATELLMGLSISMTCIAEVPFFFFFNHLLKLLGVRGVLYLSFGCYVIRLLYYSVITNPWLVLPAELLHGVTYAASWSACVIHAKTLAPPGLEATMQGLLTGTHWGIGVGTGSLMAGILYEHLGAVNTFRVTAGISAGGLFFYFLSNRLTDFLSRRGTPPSAGGVGGRGGIQPLRRSKKGDGTGSSQKVLLQAEEDG